VETFRRAGQAINDIMNMRTACWIPKAIDTLRICNTYRLSQITTVARTLLNIML